MSAEVVPPFPRVWSATEIMETDFPEPRFAVPGLIPEGLTLLCATPKFGKSWWVLSAAIAVASGGVAFGRVSVDRGPALYLALEDTPRRLKNRLAMLLDGDPVPEGLDLITEWPIGLGIDMVRSRLDVNPATRLVVVDVLTKTRPSAITGESSYAADYRAMSQWKDVADLYGVAVVLVHHTRKATADDFLDAVSGTQGLAGAADAVMVMHRARGTADAVLNLTGRDVAEASFAMTFHAESGRWELLDGPAAVHALPDTRRRIVELLSDHQPRTPKQIADSLRIDHANVRQTCTRMLGDDQLDAAEGYYSLSLMSPLSLDLSRASDTSDRSDTDQRSLVLAEN